MRNWPAIATARCQGLDSIVIFCHWFGPWPEWFPLTLATMAANPSVQWVFVTDNAPPPCRPHNVSFECISLAEYLEKARDILATPIVTPNPHQISRLKIFTGKLQEKIVQDFDWFGYCDLDVVFGDIRRIYTPALMDRHSMLTTHRDLVAGHFTLFRNTALLRNVYRLIPHWEHYAAIEDEPVNLEEWHLAPVFGVLPR